MIAQVVHNGLPEAVREWGAGIVAILITAAIFDPLKRRIQSWVEKAFDRHRYDYRKALVDFGRGLNSETDLDALLASIVERLPKHAACGAGCRLSGRRRGTVAAGRIAWAPIRSERGAGSPCSGFLDFDQQRSLAHLS